MLEIAGLKFQMTCGACPEQYDVYLKNEKHEDDIVAYVRLRCGTLSCKYPDVGGEQIFVWAFQEPLKGTFGSEEERTLFLTMIAGAIHSKIYREEK